MRMRTTKARLLRIQNSINFVKESCVKEREGCLSIYRVERGLEELFSNSNKLSHPFRKTADLKNVGLKNLVAQFWEIGRLILKN